MTTPLLTYGHKAGVRVDLDALVRSRLLIQANSGGGKSWALRQLLEETFGKVQHLVIDPEDEFASLREEFDYVLAAKHGGDVEATPRTAKVLCRRLMETSASAIISINELKMPFERREFVKLFLNELMSLPKELRRPVLVVLDEAHQFAPEGAKSEALEAVMTLASQGRKRGYALVCATQRLSKLSKDVAAELLTRMIGRTGLDLDVKRAADELGMDKEARSKLRDMEPGTFWVFGPAIVPAGAPRLVRTGTVRTSHPEVGKVSAPAPEPSARVRALIAKSLADLPQQATEEARTVASLEQKLKEMTRQLDQKLPARAELVSGKQIEIAIEQAVAKERVRLTREHSVAVAAAVKPFQDYSRDVTRLLYKVANHARGLSDLVGVIPVAPSVGHVGSVGGGGVGRETGALEAHHRSSGGSQDMAREKPSRVPFTSRRDSSMPPTDLPSGERTVLTAIAQHDDGVTREQLTVLTGYKRSTRDAYIQRMHQKGLVNILGNKIVATTDGVEALGADFEPLPTGRALYEYWINGPLPMGEKRILVACHAAYPEAVSRDQLSEETGFARSSRDAYIQRLAARKLVVSNREGVTMSAHLHG